MQVAQIDEMLQRKDTLSEDEKSQVVKAIYENEEANTIAVRGAIMSGNMGLALHLIYHKPLKSIGSNE